MYILKKIIKASDTKYSLKEDDTDNVGDVDEEINATMTMDEAKTMIQRAFVLGDIRNWFDGEYKNGDEWIKGEGIEAVALIIDNEYALQEKIS